MKHVPRRVCLLVIAGDNDRAVKTTFVAHTLDSRAYFTLTLSVCQSLELELRLISVCLFIVIHGTLTWPRNALAQIPVGFTPASFPRGRREVREWASLAAALSVALPLRSSITREIAPVHAGANQSAV